MTGARAGARSVCAAALVAACVLWAGLARPGEPEPRPAPVGPLALAAYPGPPVTPSPTPAPDLAGRFPPPDDVPWVPFDAARSPVAAEVAWLAGRLSEGNAAALAAAVAGDARGLLLERYVETEGFAIRWRAAEVRASLETLHQAGSRPVLQGLFAEPCRGAREPCTLLAVTTGWRGALAMPTRPPSETLGSAPPRDLAIGAAAWELAQDGAGGVGWRAWWIGDGYHALVRDLYDRGLGTYTLVR